MSTILWMLVAAAVGYWIGWNDAHNRISKEIKLLGKFFVGKEVFSGKWENPTTDTYPAAPPKPKNKGNDI